MFVSLISGGVGYLKGAIALGNSMRKQDPEVHRLLLVEIGAYLDSQIDWVRQAGWEIKMVDPVRPPACKFKAKRWPQTFTKLHIWGVDASKIVYIDADCLVVKPVYEKLTSRRFENLAACWVSRGSKRFNTGMMVLKPDKAMAKQMIQQIRKDNPKKTGAAGSDQAYLNLVFDKWTQLPDKFNFRWWERAPGDLHIAHIRPHPWSGRKGSANHDRIISLWNRHLAGQ